MRNELAQIQKIESYLKGEMPENEKISFEAQMAGDPDLREAVRLQEDLMNGIERAALRPKMQAAAARYKLIRNIKNWGLPGLGLMAIIAAILFFTGKSAEKPESRAVAGDVKNAQGTDTTSGSSSDSNREASHGLPVQTFAIEASGDTVVETSGGIVLFLPANGFLDEKGQTVKGRIELTIKEALDAASIMKAGLSTLSGDDLLESAGMFDVEARQGESVLQINPAHAIHAQVPTDSIRRGMQAFSGKQLPDGRIDWQDPRPLVHDLLPVDISLLDFYPPHYLDSLAKWGYNTRRKAFTDSLYYSFAQLFAQPPSDPSKGKKNDAPRETLSDSAVPPMDQMADFPRCAINPAKIKTIWSQHYQNTLLSTREFGERMPWIHASGNNQVLDLYVNNLDKNMSSIDSMAAMLLPGELKARFLAFAAHGNGKLTIDAARSRVLRKYYEKKALAFTEAIAATQNKFWSEQTALDNVAAGKRSAHLQSSAERGDRNFEEEFMLNLKEAYRQLGYPEPKRFRPWNAPAYGVPVVQTGWCNVDRFVYESARTHTTMKYTDPETGKRARIGYYPVSFTIEKSSSYDRCYVYLLADKLNSFIRLTERDGAYADGLNELMKYRMICIAYKGEQAYCYSIENVVPGNYPPVSLKSIDTKELDQLLREVGSRTQAVDIQKENDYFRFEIRDQKREDRNTALMELGNKMTQFLFPCSQVEGVK